MTREQILAELQSARQAVAREASSLRYELDYAAKARRWIGRNPAASLGIATLVGYLLSGKKQRREKRRSSRPERGKEAAVEAVKKTSWLALLTGLVRFLMPVLRPVLLSFATRKLADFTGNPRRMV